MVKICRLCATLRKDEQLVTIEDTNHEICHKLLKCCQVEIRIDDLLPKCVCMSCIEALQQAFAFYTKVHESQESLSVFYPTSIVKDEVPSVKVASAEKRLPSVLNEQTLLLTPNNDDQITIEQLQFISNTEEDAETSSLLEKTLKVDIDDETILVEIIHDELQESQTVCYSASMAKDHVISKNIEPVGTPRYYKEVNPEIVTCKSDVKIPPTVIKVERDDTVEELQFISNIAKDRDATFSLEKSLKEDIDDVEMLVQKILERRNHDVVVDDCNEISAESEDNSAVPSKGSIKRKNSKRLSKNKHKSKMQELSKEMILAEKRTESVQCSDVGASNETWSSYSWSCHHCECKEPSFWDLVLHCQFQHGILRKDMHYKCSDCQKSGLPYYTFVNHVRFRHRSALTLCCDVCDMRCDDFEALDVHRRTQHSNERVYPSVLLCCECGRAFFTKNALRLHKRDHTNKQRFECNQCGAVYKSAYSLKDHQKVHSDVGGKEYNCEHCGKSFRQKANLKTHRYTHSDDKPYKCSICKKSFKTSMYLMNHKKRHLNIKLFKCDHCEKSYSTKDAKLIHERTHTGEMPYKCEYCMRPFRNRGPYMDHLNGHTGNKPYSCLTCDKYFINWSNFHKHMKRCHADDAAQTKNRTPRSLKHSKIQTVVKLFTCDYCEKPFHTKDAKLSHMRTHTGEMPFVCKHCSRSFRYRRKYMNHLYEHNADKSFSCKICDLRFTNFSTYLPHMKTHHAEDKAETEKRKPQSNKIPEETFFQCKEKVANAVHSPTTTSGVLVEESCNALDVVLDDHLIVKEESAIQDQEVNS